MESSVKWEKLLSPEVMRERLISASMYITAFEILKDAIVEHIRNFYFIGIDENGPILSSEYQVSVLSRNKSPLYASLAWLVESNAIDQSDLEVFERLKGVRNKLAHDLPALVLGGEDLQLTTHFQEACELLRKIEVWWVVNVDMPTNPDYDGQEIDEKGITPGSVLMVQLMLDVANGNEEYLHHYRAKHAASRRVSDP